MFFRLKIKCLIKWQGATLEKFGLCTWLGIRIIESNRIQIKNGLLLSPIKCPQVYIKK